VAAAVALAMLRCMARRLVGQGRTVIAVTPDGGGEALAKLLGGDVDCTYIDQGPGDLGQRLDRVWRRVGRACPVAFFGADTPDVPQPALAAIDAALQDHDVALGPTSDGGYWTLAANRYQPALLQDIDWGKQSVYDQTLLNAHQAGLKVFSLPLWRDVDHPSDLTDLRRRLAEVEDLPRHAALVALARRLEALCGFAAG
jgi:hypothetical protein